MEPGHRYAVRVQAQSVGDVSFKNNGYSEVASFWWMADVTPYNAKTAGLIVEQNVFPKADTLPFRGMPIVVRLGPSFDPASRDVIRFDSEFTIIKSGGARGLSPFARTLKWYTRSPLETQQRATGLPITAEQARHIALSHPSGDDRYSFYTTMERGRQYEWNASVSLTHREGRKESVVPLPPVQGSFVAGMGKPILRSPADKSTQQRGEIAFSYETAKGPQIGNIQPFDIVQAKGSQESIASFNVFVRERAVLEVSDTVEFTPAARILHRKTLLLDKNILNAAISGEVVNWESIKAFLYKSDEARFTFDKDGQYFWRVRWLKDPDGAENGASYADSPTWSFRIGDTGDDDTDDGEFKRPPDLAEVECENCERVEMTPSTDFKPIRPGTIVKVGHFLMEVSEADGSAATSWSGKGTIINFRLMGLSPRLNVTFTGLKAAVFENGGARYLQAKEGIVTTVSRGTELLLLAELANNQPLSLPLGVDFIVSGHHVLLQLHQISFYPNKATARINAAWDLPADLANGESFSFSARDVCILPGRFGNEVTYALDRDIAVNRGDAYEFLFKGAPTGIDVEASTFLQFKCDTVSFQLAGALTFPRTTMLPLSATGQVIEGDTKVSGLFRFRIDRFAHVDQVNEESETETGMIAQFSFSHPFGIPDLDGWGFTVGNASLDLSEIANPEGMGFPEGYRFGPWFPDGSPPSMRTLWQGMYCRDVKVRIPSYLTLKEGAENPEFGISHLLVDRTGISVSITGDDVLAMDQAGWDFSIQHIALSVIQTTTFSGNMNGRLRLPNFDPGHYLDYNMLVTTADRKPAYTCTVRVKDEPLKMSLWLLDVRLAPTSRIDFLVGRKPVPGEPEPKRSLQLKGVLNGYLGIQRNPAIDKLDDLMDIRLDEVKFENFKFDTDSAGFFAFSGVNWREQAGEVNPVMAFASPQHSAGRLPISITNFDVVKEGGKPGLQIGAELNLSEMGFKAAMGMTIFGNMETSYGVIPTNVGYDHIRLDIITVDCDFAGFKLNGDIVYYNQDDDKGYKGDIAVAMPLGLSGRLTAQFGSRGESGQTGYFRYWFVDGMVYLRDGIPVSPALEIKAFGGGAWYHMKLANPDEMEREKAAGLAQEVLNTPADAEDPEKVPASGLRYVPDKDIGLGLSVAAVFALQGDETVFNMDVAVKVEFTADWGLNRAGLTGNGYLLQELDKRTDPSIKAKVDLFYNHNGGDWNFSGNLSVMVDLAGVVVGRHAGNMAGEAQLYFDHDGKWYFKLGGMDVDRRIALSARFPRDLARLDVDAYFMVGHDIPTELPPLPDFIQTLLNGPTDEKGSLTGNYLTGNQDRGNRASDQGNYKTGKGIAFGAHLDFHYDKSFLLFYASLRLAVGADINFSKPSEVVLCSNAVDGARGFKGGWYGKGQAYAGFEGEFGIEVDLLIFKGRINIASVGAAAAMEIQLPNPTYLGGRVGLRYSILGGRLKGDCNYQIETGEKCNVDGSPLGDIQFISEIWPENGARDVPPRTKIRTVFNFPMDYPFEIEEQNGSSIKVRTFVPFIHSYTVTPASSSALSAVTSYEREGIVGVLTSKSYLKGETSHTARVEVRVNETTSGSPVLLNVPGQGAFSESRPTTFTTGPLPTTIELDETEAWPIVNQRYFLQNEGNEDPHYGSLEFTGGHGKAGKKGYIKLRQDYLFTNSEFGRYAATGSYPPPPTAAVSAIREVRYGAAFIPHSQDSQSLAGAVIKNVKYYPGADIFGSQDTPYNGAIEFEIPELQNSVKYRLKIVRFISGSLDPALMVSSNDPQSETKVKKVDIRNTITGRDGRVAATMIKTVNKLETPVEEEGDPAEFILTNYAFQTSRFNNHREKFVAILSQQITTADAPYTWKLDGGENFETGDFAISQDEANGAFGLEYSQRLIQMQLRSWFNLPYQPDLHPKFRKYQALYESYKPFEVGFVKSFPSLVPPPTGMTNAYVMLDNELKKLKSNYLGVKFLSNLRVETRARITGIPAVAPRSTETAWPFFRYPYYAIGTSLSSRISDSTGPGGFGVSGGAVQAIGVSAGGSGSTGSGGRGLGTGFNAGVSASVSAVTGSAAQVGQASGSAGGSPGASGGGSITLIRDRTNELMKSNINFMFQKLLRFKEKVPVSKDIVIDGRKMYTLKPLTSEEWLNAETFFAIRENATFIDWSVQAPPSEPIYGGQGLQEIEFIYWVPTKSGSYPTQPIRIRGTQYIR